MEPPQLVRRFHAKPELSCESLELYLGSQLSFLSVRQTSHPPHRYSRYRGFQNPPLQVYKWDSIERVSEQPRRRLCHSKQDEGGALGGKWDKDGCEPGLGKASAETATIFSSWLTPLWCKGHVQILLAFISPFIPGASCRVGTKSNHCVKKAREPEGKEDRAASVENALKTRASTASPFQPCSALSPPQPKGRKGVQ